MIDKRILEFVLTDQQDEIALRASEKLCERGEVGLIDLDSPQAQVVIGVRRSGKSTLCYQALKKAGVKFAFVDFDDERLAKISSEQFNDVLEVLYKINGDFQYLFLDEIQNIEGWHLFVNRLLRRKMHVIVTGSNAKLLSGELATHLSGRNKEIILYPFSFREYCDALGVETDRKSTIEEAARRNAFDDFMKTGGFPELITIKDNKSYIKDLIGNVLVRDIEQRYKIAYKAAFEELANHLLNNTPTIISYKDLSELFKIRSIHTVKNYVDYLKQAFILIGVYRYSTKSRLRLTQEKIYPIDVAFMNRRNNAFAGDNLGFRLETIVLIHLKRKCFREDMDVYYFNERNSECDFVVCKGNKVVRAIQVSFNISSEKTLKREIKGLTMVADKTKCDNLLLLTDCVRDTIKVGDKTIEVKPVYDWCLEL